MGGIGTALTLLDGSLSANGDFRTGFCLHLLQSVSTRTNK
jgi:hypothetical protein